MPDSVPFFVSEDLFTALHIDPNQQYVPIRPLLQTLALTPTTHERALRRHAVLATGLKPLWIFNEHHQRIPALCLRMDLLPLWLSTLPSTPGSLLARWQEEIATTLWQQCKPSGASPRDGHVSERPQQSACEEAYTEAQEIAAIARQQLFAERELQRQSRISDAATPPQLPDAQTNALVVAIRDTALYAAQLNKRNDYLSIFTGLVRLFQVTSLRSLSPSRLAAALAWLAHWRGDDTDDAAEHS